MEHGPKARRVLVLLVGAEVGVVVGLHRLGGVDGFAIPRHDLSRWLQQTPSEDVLLAGVRLAALVAAWWLLATTVLYLVARAARLHRTARTLEWATLPAVRRWADRAVAVSIVAASTLGAARPAGADPPPTTTAPAPVVLEIDHRGHSSRPDLPSVTTAPSPSRPLPPVTPPVPVTPPPGSPAPTSEVTHRVTPGEHLWAIAAATLATRTSRPVAALSPADIAPFWTRLVERNRARVRSGNPSLVYPGEVLEVPPG